MVTSPEQGHYSRRQGHYGEALFRLITAAAHLKISKEELEPEGIDFQVTHELSTRLPRCKRAEFQVKTHPDISRRQDGSLQVKLKRNSYHALNGSVGVELDIPRYLVVVNIPRHHGEYCTFSQTGISLSERVYWHSLMGEADLPEGQTSVTLSVASDNLLTPETLVSLTCGDSEEAAEWMSA